VKVRFNLLGNLLLLLCGGLQARILFLAILYYHLFCVVGRTSHLDQSNANIGRSLNRLQWVLIAKVPSASSFSFFFGSALGPIHLFEKKIKDGWRPNKFFGYCYVCFGCVIDTIWSMPKVCIIRQKICVWAAPRCVWSSPDKSCWASGQLGKKRSRRYRLQ
jgi:hypothetical protein